MKHLFLSPKVQCFFLKAYWSKEREKLRQKSRFSLQKIRIQIKDAMCSIFLS